MRAFKCDRCGKFFEDYLDRKTSRIYNITTDPCMTGKCLDLCKDCSDELQNWVDAFTIIEADKESKEMTQKDYVKKSLIYDYLIKKEKHSIFFKWFYRTIWNELYELMWNEPKADKEVDKQ